MTIGVPALETDIAAISEIAGGDASTVVAVSNGRLIPSITKVITDSFQYKGPSIAWVPALDVTDTLQTYSESGVIYIPKPSAVPFTTGATFPAEAANWLPLQGYVNASGADLDLAGGAINNVGPANFTGAISFPSISGNWTNVGNTIDDLGIVTTVIINGGTLDGVSIDNSTLDGSPIGGITPSSGEFTLVIGHDAYQSRPQAAQITGDITSGLGLYTNTGAGFSLNARIDGEVSLVGGGNKAGMDMVFSTAPDAVDGIPVEGLRLRDDSRIIAAEKFNEVRSPAAFAAQPDVAQVTGDFTEGLGIYANIVGVQFLAAKIAGRVSTVGGGIKAGMDLVFYTNPDGTAALTERGSFHDDGGLIVGSPTGSSQGAGTINAQGVYDDGSLLTCYVPLAAQGIELVNEEWDPFSVDRVIPEVPEQEYQIAEVVEIEKAEFKEVDGVGRIVTSLVKVSKPKFKDVPILDDNDEPIMVVKEPAIAAVPALYDEDQNLIQAEIKAVPAVMGPLIKKFPVMETIPAVPEKTETRTHEGMRKFRARLGTEFDPLDPDKYANHWKEKHHLTSMPNKDNYLENPLSTGEWVQRLVETVEIQAVHIDKLNERLKALGG